MQDPSNCLEERSFQLTNQAPVLKDISNCPCKFKSLRGTKAVGVLCDKILYCRQIYHSQVHNVKVHCKWTQPYVIQHSTNLHLVIIELYFTGDTKGSFQLLTSVQPWALGITDPDFAAGPYNISTIIKKEKKTQTGFHCPGEIFDKTILTEVNKRNLVRSCH